MSWVSKYVLYGGSVPTSRNTASTSIQATDPLSGRADIFTKYLIVTGRYPDRDRYVVDAILDFFVSPTVPTYQWVLELYKSRPFLAFPSLGFPSTLLTPPRPISTPNYLSPSYRYYQAAVFICVHVLFLNYVIYNLFDTTILQHAWRYQERHQRQVRPVYHQDGQWQVEVPSPQRQSRIVSDLLAHGGWICPRPLPIPLPLPSPIPWITGETKGPHVLTQSPIVSAPRPLLLPLPPLQARRSSLESLAPIPVCRLARRRLPRLTRHPSPSRRAKPLYSRAAS